MPITRSTCSLAALDVFARRARLLLDLRLLAAAWTTQKRSSCIELLGAAASRNCVRRSVCVAALLHAATLSG